MSNMRKPSAPQASGYSNAGGSLTRRATRSFRPDSNSPSQDINQNNATLRQRSRMLYMSSPIAASAINTNRTKVVGTGLTLKTAIDRDVLGLTPETAKKWQSQTEAEFRLWAENRRNCDALGMNNFYGLQQLALKSWLMSGDVFALIKRAQQTTKLNPYTLRLHLVEADRVSTPDTCGDVVNRWANITEGKNTNNGNKIYDGVEVDGQRALPWPTGCETPTRARFRRSKPSGSALRPWAGRLACRTSCTSWTASARTSTAACRIWPLSLKCCSSCGATRNPN